jgi:hypothetical protein
MTEPIPPTPHETPSRRHLRLGLWGLCVFVSLGAVLEALHGFKVGIYLDANQDARRFMWRLAHAHGTLLSLFNVVFALLARRWPSERAARLPIASGSLAAATVLLPVGFFLGGIFTHGGDPGLGVLLVPIGAALLLLALVLTALSV